MATFKKVVTETSADTIAQSTTGSSATLTTARAIAVSGDVSGTANFDGSAGIDISTSLGTGVVATANIANQAITHHKIGTDAVTGVKIQDGAVSADKLDAGAVTAGKIADNAVTNAKMADDAVDSAEIADGAVDPIHLAGLGANGTSGQILQSVGDGTFRWASANDGDITGVTAGTGLNGGGANGDVTLNLDTALTTVTSLYNGSLSIGAGSGKARMEFGTNVINMSADSTAITLVLENENASTDTDNLRPKTHRGVNLGTSTHHFNVFYTRTAVLTDAIIGTIKIGDANSNTAVTSTADELNILDGVTASTEELNLLDGVTATTAELNYVDGVTSNVQTQLNAKAPLASPSFTGNVTVGGDLTVSGTTITTNTETLEIADNTLVLNSDLTGTAVDAGIVVEQGSSGDNACLWYDASEGAWVVGSNSSASLPSSGTRIALQSVKATLDTTDTSVPVGGFQVAGGVAYVRTA